MRQLQQRVTASGSSLNDTVLRQLKAMALQNVIADYVLTEAATRAGFEVSKQQAQQFLMTLPVFQENGQFSPEKFQQYLYSNNLNVNTILSQLQNSLLVEQVMGGIQSSVFTLPNELAYYYNLFYQQRSLQYLVIPASRFAQEVTVTPALMQQYYDNNREALRVPEKVSIEYLLVSPEKLRQTVTVSDAAITSYYEAHPEKYRDAQQKPRPLAAVKDSIRTTLLLQKVQNRFARVSDQLSSLVFTNPDSLAPAAQALKLPLQTTGLFTAEGDPKSIAQYPEVVSAAFSADVLQHKNNSNLITLKNGDLVVLRVKDYLPSEIPPLTAVAAQIRQQLTTQLAQTKAALLANQIQQALQQQKTPAAVAAPLGLSWTTSQDAKRNDKRVPAAVLQAAFAATKVGATQAVTASLANGDTAVVFLVAVKPAQFNTLASKEQDDFKQKIQQMLADLTYQLYMVSVQKNVATKVYAQPE